MTILLVDITIQISLVAQMSGLRVKRRILGAARQACQLLQPMNPPQQRLAQKAPENKIQQLKKVEPDHIFRLQFLLEVKTSA